MKKVKQKKYNNFQYNTFYCEKTILSPTHNSITDGCYIRSQVCLNFRKSNLSQSQKILTTNIDIEIESFVGLDFPEHYKGIVESKKTTYFEFRNIFSEH